MQFGVCLPTFPFGVVPSTASVVEVARAAEELSYDSVWASDHVLPPADKPRYGHLYEAVTTLSFLAGITRRVRLGISVLVLPQRNAILVAKQIATLDVLSGGRVILGVGAGWIDGEFRALGADFQRRGRHLDEGIRVLKTLWQDPDPRFTGEFYRFEGVLFEPRPIQSGGPPLWVGGYTEVALRRAAQLGDAWHADDLTLDRLDAMRRKLQALAAEAGRSVQVTLRRTVDMRSAAVEAGVLSSPAAGGGTHTGRFPAASAGALAGSLAEIETAVRQAAAVGVTHFICQFEHASQEEHLTSMELFAKAAIRKFKET